MLPVDKCIEHTVYAFEFVHIFLKSFVFFDYFVCFFLLVKQKSFTHFSESTYSKVPVGVIAMVEKDGIKAFSFSGIKRVKWALSS